MIRLAVLSLLLLTGCSAGEVDGDNTVQAQDLESAAIARGLVRDPSDREIVGLYARDTDRVCLVSGNGRRYRIGAYVDYGEGITCSASGSVERHGDRLEIRLGGGDSCHFDARLSGDQILFPGSLPDGCASFCQGRAALTGLEAARLSGSVAEARAMRDAAGRRLCGA